MQELFFVIILHGGIGWLAVGWWLKGNLIFAEQTKRVLVISPRHELFKRSYNK